MALMGYHKPEPHAPPVGKREFKAGSSATWHVCADDTACDPPGVRKVLWSFKADLAVCLGDRIHFTFIFMDGPDSPRMAGFMKFLDDHVPIGKGRMSLNVDGYSTFGWPVDRHPGDLTVTTQLFRVAQCPPDRKKLVRAIEMAIEASI
jgi:hypothetical protein